MPLGGISMDDQSRCNEGIIHVSMRTDEDRLGEDSRMRRNYSVVHSRSDR
jgi:hypothetical protein